MAPHGAARAPTTVQRLTPSDAELAEPVTRLINRAYAEAQAELFARPAPRTSVAAVDAAIADGALVVAERGAALVGAVVTRDLDERTAFFGMLAVAPEAASEGVARALLDAIESDASARGRRAMELDLLVPELATPHQSRLRTWYERRGYVAVRERPFSDADPESAALLRQPSNLLRYARQLAPSDPGSLAETT